MATQEQILAELREAQYHTGLAYTMVKDTVPSTPTEIPVKAGDNILQLVQDSPDDSVFDVAADFTQDVGACVWPKPSTIKAQMGAKLVNASIDARPRDVRFIGMQIDGAKEVTIFTCGPRSYLEKNTLNGHVTTQHRGVMCNTEGCRILSNKILNIRKWQDTQAVAGFNGTKDLIIDDNDLEASGENIMFGGDTTTSDSAIPSDILITRNRLWKKPEWKADTLAACKNLIELKEARRVTIRGNTGEYSFNDAQIGYAIVFSVRNQYGRSPWATIEDILVEENNFAHMGGAVSILGRDDTVKDGVRYPSVVMNNVRFRKNRFEDIDSSKWGPNGRTVFISGGPHNLWLEENYFDGPLNQINQAMLFDRAGDPYFELTEGLHVIKNRFIEGYYGMMAQGGPGLGEVAIAFAAPNYDWQENTVKKSGIRNIKWPTSTIFEAA